MTAYHEDLSWFKIKNLATYQKTLKQKGNKILQM